MRFPFLDNSYVNKACIGGSMNPYHQILSYSLPYHQILSHGLSSIIFKLIIWLRILKRSICFCRAAAFISGLASAEKAVNLAVVEVLITYFTENCEYSIREAAALVNFHEGLSSITEILFPLLADVYLGCFKVVLYSTFSHIMGLVILYHDRSLLPNIIGLVLLALGIAGLRPVLKTFLADQLRAHEPESNQDENRVKTRAMVWLRFAIGSSLILANLLIILEILNSWERTFIFSLSVMGCGLFLLLCGKCFYHSTKSSSGDKAGISVHRVFMVALRKQFRDRPSCPAGFYNNARNGLPLLPDIKCLRWVDKAAIIDSSSLSPGQQEVPGRHFSVAEVQEFKHLCTMGPMFVIFIGFGLVTSTADTFFPEQGDNLRDQNYFILLLVINFLSSRIATFTGPKLTKVLEKCTPAVYNASRQGIMVIIWLGLVLSVFCCAVAWQVEVHRLDLVRSLGLQNKPDHKVPMSVLWLAPQFTLSGLSQGLALQGLVVFFESQVSGSIGRYGSELEKFVTGIGSILSIGSVYVFRSWFGHTLNTSRLDKYYMMLTIVSIIITCLFVPVCLIYKSIDKTVDAARAETETATKTETDVNVDADADVDGDGDVDVEANADADHES